MSAWEDSWHLLVNKRAALKEQFPALRDVAGERPGSDLDRANREFYHADNRRTAPSHRDQEVDADRFIAEMSRKHEEQFTAAFAARQQARRTA